MENRLTAKQANELANKQAPQGSLDKILLNVKRQAENGKTSLRVHNYGFSRNKLPEERCTPEQLGLIIALRELGYTVGIKKETTPLLDIYLLITW